MFDAVSFCQDHGIEYWLEGSKNVSSGWIGLQCPFCDDRSNHLGIELNTGRTVCWKCGSKPLWKVIKVLTNEKDPNDAIDRYSWGTERNIRSTRTDINEIDVTGIKPLSDPFRDYLKKRNFDPDYIENKYDLRYGEPFSKERYRLIIPVKYMGKNVSYQTRRIFDDKSMRYKNCKIEESVIQNKEICYNLDNCKKRVAIGVEGITDVWRIGDDCFATFGTEFTPKQLLVLKDHFNKIFWLYDPTKEAREKALKASYILSAMGIETEIVGVEGIDDPGSMKECEVVELRKELRLF